VIAAAEQLGFVPSAVARGLASRRTGVVGLLVPDLTDPHYPQIAIGVDFMARRHHRAVLIYNSHGDRAQLGERLRLMQERRVDAAVISGGSSLAEDELQMILDSQLPVVLIGRPGADLLVPYVSVDNVRGAMDATEHLVQLGRQRVAHLAGPVSQTTMADRAAGYEAALVSHRRSQSIVFPTDGTPEHAYTIVKHEVPLEPIDGLFAATDRLAIAAMAALHDLGLRMPEDVAVIGFDDMPLASYLRPALASVAQPARQLGEAATLLALRVADGDSPRPLVLSTQLELRASAQG
jgi:LacI family transcriptional regulator